MHAEILTIGSELTSGITVNTNAAYLERELSAIGIDCRRQTTVPDKRPDLLLALTEAIQRSRLVITTGGLGPTFDDITMEAIAQATQRSLRYSPKAALRLRRLYVKRYYRLLRRASRQAYLPEGGEALPNPIGTAPGLWLSLNGRIIVALPGVPSEMRAILQKSVLPRLKRLSVGEARQTRILRSAGLVELQIESVLRKLPIPDSIDVGLYPKGRLVDIRLTAKAKNKKAARQLLDRLALNLRRRLGMAVYGSNQDTLEGVIGRLLVKKRKKLAIAESCTGGGVSDRITAIPGSSRYLLGSVVAYHNAVKQKSLGVERSLLLRYGAVSRPVAEAMACGVRKTLGADIGLSVTGIAGPAGGTPQKPVGLVWFGLADKKTVTSLRVLFAGDRQTIKAQAVQTTLDWLRRYLITHR